MSIKSLVMAAIVGVGTLTLAGCVEGGGYYGYSGVYASGPFYGDGYYRGYRRDYYRGYHGRYYRPDYAGRWHDGDRPRGPRPGPGPGREYHGGGDNGRIILPNPDSPRGPMFSRGGN